MKKNRFKAVVTALLPLLGVAAVLLSWALLMMAIDVGHERTEKEVPPSSTVSAELSRTAPEPTSEMEEAAPLYLYDPSIPLSPELQAAFHEACLDHDVPEALVLGVMEVESGFDPEADNGLCFGLMQLNRNYFSDKLSPADNIRAGVAWLAELMEQYSTPSAALRAYNRGFDDGDRQYAQKVLEAAERWAKNEEETP